METLENRMHRFARNSCALIGLVACFVVGGLAQVAPSPGRHTETSAAKRGAAADDFLTRTAALGRFNGVALLAIDGHIVLQKGYGFADFQHRISNTADTQFEIASLSKMFTAYAILQLRDRGVLRLEDPICRYLRPCPASWGAITIAQVIHHRSGIPDYEDALGLASPEYLEFMSKPQSGRRILEQQEALPLDFPPGTKFSYSNTGYIVLSAIVEQAAHEPFGRFLHRSILFPSGMSQTGVLGEDKAPMLAVGYQNLEPSWVAYARGINLAATSPKPFPALSLEPPHGDAQLFSTVGDLYLWCTLTQGSGIVPPNNAQTIFKGEDGYGFGWFIDKHNETTEFSHTGSLPGYLGGIKIFPDKHVTVIYLANYYTITSPIEKGLAAIALGEPYDMPFSGEVKEINPSEVEPLLGTYRLSDGDIISVSKGKAVPLIVKNPKRYAFGLIAISRDRFFLPLNEGTVTFGDFVDRTARQINLHFDGIDHLGKRQ
jgi:CubicO group peptidase (beta-lactamase class C family)